MLVFGGVVDPLDCGVFQLQRQGTLLLGCVIGFYRDVHILEVQHHLLKDFSGFGFKLHFSQLHLV